MCIRDRFEIVRVWKLDRFARNRDDSARYKTQLKKNGVKLMSATEIISEVPEGIILESVLEGYAEYYSADPVSYTHLWKMMLYYFVEFAGSFANIALLLLFIGRLFPKKEPRCV